MAIAATQFFLTKNLSFIGRLSLNFSARHYASALFIPGNKANETFAVLTPVLDFDTRFSDPNKLKNELELRGIEMDIDGFKSAWDFYRYVNSNRSTLEQKRSDIANQMKSLSKIRNPSADDEHKMNQLKMQGKVLKEDLKVVREALWELEDSVVSQALKLPNVLHKNTPPSDPTILQSFGGIVSPEKSKFSKSHIDIGRNLGLLEYTSPMNYYLCNEAALFELAVLRLANDIFTADNMLRITGLDFSRSVIVEGTGIDHEDPEESFILKDNEEIERHSPNRMHLVGGASLPSFLAMHAKQLINPNHFPLRYFASGRQYVPFSSKQQEAGLFTVCQSAAAEVFVAVKDLKSEEYEQEFDRIISSMRLLYNDLCTHYRVVIIPAKDLKRWESLRVSFQLWSPYLDQYVEVGHISLCGEYFSKRLLIGCQTPTGRTFPSVISGTVLSVPRLLGCLLEECPEKFAIPTKIQGYMPA